MSNPMRAAQITALICDNCGLIHLAMLNKSSTPICIADMSPADWDKMVLEVEQQRALKAREAANRIRI